MKIPDFGVTKMLPSYTVSNINLVRCVWVGEKIRTKIALFAALFFRAAVISKRVERFSFKCSIVTGLI